MAACRRHRRCQAGCHRQCPRDGRLATKRPPARRLLAPFQRALANGKEVKMPPVAVPQHQLRPYLPAAGSLRRRTAASTRRHLVARCRHRAVVALRPRPHLAAACHRRPVAALRLRPHLAAMHRRRKVAAQRPHLPAACHRRPVAALRLGLRLGARGQARQEVFCPRSVPRHCHVETAQLLHHQLLGGGGQPLLRNERHIHRPQRNCHYGLQSPLQFLPCALTVNSQEI